MLSSQYTTWISKRKKERYFVLNFNSFFFNDKRSINKRTTFAAWLTCSHPRFSWLFAYSFPTPKMNQSPLEVNHPNVVTSLRLSLYALYSYIIISTLNITLSSSNEWKITEIEIFILSKTGIFENSSSTFSWQRRRCWWWWWCCGLSSNTLFFIPLSLTRSQDTPCTSCSPVK